MITASGLLSVSDNHSTLVISDAVGNNGYALEHALVGPITVGQNGVFLIIPRWNGLYQAHSIVQPILVIILVFSVTCHIFTKQALLDLGWSWFLCNPRCQWNWVGYIDIAH